MYISGLQLTAIVHDHCGYRLDPNKKSPGRMKPISSKVLPFFLAASPIKIDKMKYEFFTNFHSHLSETAR